MSSRAASKKWKFKRYRAYEASLRKTASDWFNKKGYATDPKYPFILEKHENWRKNIILPEVREYIKNEIDKQKEFPLHKFVHHGLSSQALIFNLVGPMIVKNDITPLINCIKKKGGVMPNGDLTADFEYEDRKVFNEDSGQPTSIDLVIKDKDNPFIFIESKFVEKEFGGCSVYKKGDCDGANPKDDPDSCFLNFIGRKYWEALKEFGFLETAIGTDSSCVFINNYQYFREVLFALKKEGTFVLIFDERNPTFFNSDGVRIRGLMPYLKSLTPEKYHNRILHISIQEIVNEIILSGNHPWIEDFKMKYGL